jgi:WD40 repeat protein
MALRPDGKSLATASQFPAQVWDLASGKNTLTLKGLTRPQALAFAPDGKTLASADSCDQTIRLWDLAGGKPPLTVDNTRYLVCGMACSLAFSPDGRTLASGSLDGTVELWDPATGRKRVTLGEFGRDDRAVGSLAYSPDGKLLAAGDMDPRVRLLDAASGWDLAVLTSHTFRVEAVAFSGDGKTLASGSYDKTARLWDVDAVPADRGVVWGLSVAALLLALAGSLVTYPLPSNASSSQQPRSGAEGGIGRDCRSR